jgi:dihydroorotate dehydrogenase (fumarate)
MTSQISDLSTTYLGLPLASPLVMSASPLSQQIEALQEIEACGAGAVVLHTLFEEPLRPNPDNVSNYLRHLTLARQRLKIPVIASLNATSPYSWAQLAKSLQQAGASALELNIYQMNISVTASSSRIENAYLDAVRAVTEAVKIPVAVKLPPFFTNVAFMAKELEEAGVKGLVLFNRFYQADLELPSMGSNDPLRLSTVSENRLPRRWIALLYRPIQVDLIANTGIRSGGDVLKMILSGAAAVQVCSVILQRGISWLGTLEEELRQAMQNCKITSIKEARGQLAHRYTEVPGSIEREEYQTALQGYSRFDAPSWQDAARSHP